MNEEEIKTEQGVEEILAGRLVRNLLGADDFEAEEQAHVVGRSMAVGDDQPGLLQQLSTIGSKSSPSADFVKVEKSLIALGFFTPSSRRIKNQKIKSTKFTRVVDGKKVEVSAEFHPSPVFGLPITADQDKFLALHHIITNVLKENGQISNPIRFTSAEMLRLLNTDRGGKQYRDISEWLDVMTSTTIISDGVVWEAGKRRFARDRFHVFSRAVSVGKELPDGSIADANFVWLSDWQLENINHKHVLPIDLLVYRELKNHIAKALVPLLQVWLYASQKAGSFEKKYSELCEVLSLQRFKAPSRVTQQLKASFDELVEHEYLERWRIERTADRRQLKIVFFHGSKFHRDRRRRLQERMQADDVLVVAESEPMESTAQESGQLGSAAEPDASPRQGTAPSEGTPRRADLPVVEPPSVVLGTPDIQTPGRPDDGTESKLIDQLSARGLMPSAAMRLLQGLSSARIQSVADYIDYFDFTKRTKDVGEGFLYSLIKAGEPLPTSFETRRQRRERLERQRQSENRRVLQEEMTASYERHCEAMLDLFIATDLGPEAFERRVDQRRSELLQQGGFLSGMNRPAVITGFATADVRKSLLSGLVIPYDDYCRARLPAMLSKLDLETSDIGPALSEIGQQAQNDPSTTGDSEAPAEARSQLT